MAVKHTFTSAIADDPTAAAAGQVLPSHWNADHSVAVAVSEITATGTPSSSTYLRGDGSWATPSSGSLTVGTTSVSSGTSGYVLYNNAGTLGNLNTTGTGDIVRATSPTLVTPALGTPSSLTLTNATGLPVGGISATGTPGASNFLRGDGSWQTVTTSPAGSDTQIQFNNAGSFGGSSSLTWNGSTVSLPSLSLSGNLSAAAWTTSGIGLKHSARTLTDTSSSGTVAAAYTNVLGGNTIAASSATTFTDYASLQLGTPTAGTNVTITNGWSLIAAGNIRAPSVSLGVAGTTAGTLKLSGNTSGTVTVQTAAAAGTWTMTLPSTAGSNGQALTTDGSGGLSWATPSTTLTVNSTATSGGGAGRILYDDGSKLQESSSFTFNATNPALTLSGGTVTTSNPLLDLSQTWNSSGTTFTGLKLNATSTASASGSLLMDLQVGGTTQFSVRKDGQVAFAAGSKSAPSVSIATSGGGLYGRASGYVSVSNGSSEIALFHSNSTTIINQLGLSSGDISTVAADVVLIRDGANVLSMRNGTSLQTFRLFDYIGAATDYHRLQISTARATLSNVTGASVTATGLIPAGSVIVGVTSKVTTGLGTGNGTTGYQVGTAGDPDRWADKTGTATGTSTDNRDWTAGTVENFAAATDVVVTAKGGDFNGTGVIYLSVQYLAGQSD